MGEARDVFICHSFGDAPAARAICDRLETDGIGCWIAPRDPVPGVPYGKQLVDAIDAARIVLLVFSTNANESQPVLNELELASSRAKIVLPVRIEDVAPSSNLEFYISSIHWFDAATRPIELFGPELVRHIRDLLTRSDSSGGTRPAARSINAPRHNLPFALTSFVGREREISEIETLLQTERLVTLAGAGGVGKTRCAVRVASGVVERYRDGVWFVDLAEILDGSLIPASIAAVFDLHESPNRPIFETLLAYLKGKSLLIVLDNCEHVIGDAATVVQAILRSCAAVSVLATSREVLGLTGERVYRMPTLSEPESIQLFVDRAQSGDKRFTLDDVNEPVVAGICRHLDGIPLAIELAAARAKALSVSEIERLLSERFRILTGGSRTAIPRQKTLHATIEWSYDLLTAAERELFRKIAIFIGGFTLDLATAVCGDAVDAHDVVDLVSSLVDKSLLQADFISDPTRYELLESTREYARQKLIEHGELEATIRAHANAYTELAERLEEAYDSIPDAAWADRTQAELPNWRPALRWTLGMQRDVALGQRLAAALFHVWHTMAPTEGGQWVRAALDAGETSAGRRVTAFLHLVLANLTMMNVEYRSALVPAQKALDLFTELGDERGMAYAQLVLGAALGGIGNAGEGETYLNKALVTLRAKGARRACAAALSYIGAGRLIAKDLTGKGFLEEALSIYKELGDLRHAAHLGVSLAEAEFQGGNVEAAVRLAMETLEADRAYNAVDSVAFDLSNLAAYLVALERWDEARSKASEALTLARERQLSFTTTFALQHLAATAALGNHEDSVRVLERRQLAARLVGFVDERLSTLGFAREYTEQREYDAILETLNSSLDSELSASLMAEGRRWDEDTAANKALAQ